MMFRPLKPGWMITVTRTLLNPWRDYEHQQLVRRQAEARRRAQLSSATGEKITHHRAPRGIKFSKKARKKRRK